MSGKTISFPDCNVIDPDNTISDPMSAFALTCTCRQIHQETSSLVFTSNTFLLTSFSLHTFDAHVRPEQPFLLSQLAQIRTLMVNVPENGRGMSCRLVNQGKALFEGLYPGLRMVVVRGSKEELDVFEKYVKVAGYAGWDDWRRSHEGDGVEFVEMFVGEDGESFEQ
jgi:hypothetical protein